MVNGIRALSAALLALVVTLAPGWADAERSDVEGWRGVTWGMPLEQALESFEEVVIVQNTMVELRGCFVQYGVPIELFDEAWEAWLCEERDDRTINAVSIETRTGSKNFAAFAAELNIAFGTPHRHWSRCINAAGGVLEQYRWYFRSTTITLINRDLERGWVSVRYERPKPGPEYDPGVCWRPPIDLRESPHAPRRWPGGFDELEEKMGVEPPA
jgi:hypothetical protein